MANLGRKGDAYVARFRFAGKEYKKALKTRDEATARAALHLVEVTLHRLHTGQLAVPPGVDPGDFVVSGGTRTVVPHRPTTAVPTVRAAAAEYLAAHAARLAPSYLSSQKTHLGLLQRSLGPAADRGCDSVSARHLDDHLRARLAVRHPSTVERERITLLQFFKWAVHRGYAPLSPAAGLAAVRGGDDRPPFRTAAEIEAVLARGGLSADERFAAWDTLYLAPPEIAALLAVVRARADTAVGFLLHAVPAYTGVRRGELLRLTWQDVDLAGGYLSATSRKQSRRQRETRRRVDLHPELAAVLTAAQADRPTGRFVIAEPGRDGPLTPDRANRCFWQPLRGTPWCLHRRRNLYKVGFHTYRHSFASNLAAAGVDQRVIDELMGHTTAAMAKRYRHLFPSARRAAVGCFSLRPPTPSAPLGGDRPWD